MKVSVKALLGQMAENEEMDAFVAVIRVDGCWRTIWTSGLDLGGLSLAAMKLSYDASVELHRGEDAPRPGWTPDEKSPA